MPQPDPLEGALSPDLRACACCPISTRPRHSALLSLRRLVHSSLTRVSGCSRTRSIGVVVVDLTGQSDDSIIDGDFDPAYSWIIGSAPCRRVIRARFSPLEGIPPATELMYTDDQTLMFQNLCGANGDFSVVEGLVFWAGLKKKTHFRGAKGDFRLRYHDARGGCQP